MAWFIPTLATKFNPRRSLRIRLGVAIFLITVILSLMESFFIGHSSSVRRGNEIGQSLAELGNQMTDKLDRGMFERYRDIQIVTTLDTIRNSNTPTSAKRELLEKLQNTYPDYAWIGLLNSQGKILAATGGLLEGKNGSARPVFQGGRFKPYVGDVHEALMLGKLLPNPTNEPQRFVDLSAPITFSNGMSGVLAAHLSWRWAKEIQNSLLQPLWQERQVEMLVLSKDGTVLLGSKALEGKKLNLESVQAARQGKNGYRVETWSDGKSYLTGFACSRGYRNYPGLGWLVLVRQKTEIAFAPIKQRLQQILLWDLGLGLLFASLGWLIVSYITGNLLAIAMAADRIRRGNTTVKIPVVQGVDEVAILSASLSDLVHTLTKQENELKDSNHRLRHELTERQQLEEQARQLLIREQEARQQAETVNRAKDEFLAILSHELRTPLNAMMGWTNLLRTRNLDEKTTTRALETMDRNTKSLFALVKDVLDVSQIITGKFRLEVSPVNLEPIVFAAMDTMQSTAVAKSIDLRFEILDLGLNENPKFIVLGDANRLQQIVWNLIANAVKFTPEAGRVEVQLSVEQSREKAPHQSPRFAQITVSDTGVGISADFLPYVFDRFRQADSSNTRSHGGLGLGLAIVRHLVELHGGTVCAFSPGIGQGAKFTLKLPILDERTQPVISNEEQLK